MDQRGNELMLEKLIKGQIVVPRWAFVILAVLLLGVGIVLYTMLAWNLFVPPVFGMHSLDFLQALGLDLCLLPAALVAVANIRVSDK
jgi:hypothetical protein